MTVLCYIVNTHPSPYPFIFKPLVDCNTACNVELMNVRWALYGMRNNYGLYKMPFLKKNLWFIYITVNILAFKTIQSSHTIFILICFSWTTLYGFHHYMSYTPILFFWWITWYVIRVNVGYNYWIQFAITQVAPVSDVNSLESVCLNSPEKEVTRRYYQEWYSLF